MVRVNVYFKSGNIMDFDCNGINITRNGLNQIIKYEVDHKGSQNRLFYMDMTQIEGMTIEDITDGDNYEA